MQNIVRLTPAGLVQLYERLTYADANGKSARIMTGTDANGTFFKYDVGDGWSPAFYGEDW